MRNEPELKIHHTPTENELHNRKIYEQIREHEKALQELYGQLKPAINMKRKKDGAYEKPVIYRADFAAGPDEIIRSIGRELTLLRPEMCEMLEWDEFRRLVKNHVLTDRNGFGNLTIDDLASTNDLLYCTDETYIVEDTYLVPFDRIPEIFAGHKIQVAWFNN